MFAWSCQALAKASALRRICSMYNGNLNRGCVEVRENSPGFPTRSILCVSKHCITRENRYLAGPLLLPTISGRKSDPTLSKTATVNVRHGSLAAVEASTDWRPSGPLSADVTKAWAVFGLGPILLKKAGVATQRYQ
jgi:hypothetical protein